MSSGQIITSPGISGKQLSDNGNLIVVFSLDEPRYALPMIDVERIVRAVEITKIPNAPAVIHGAINVQGRIIPVVNIRCRLQLPDREVGLNDHFIIARSKKRSIAVAADQVVGIFIPEDTGTESTGENFPQVDYIKGIIRTRENIVLIYDLDLLLSLDEEQQLDNALMAGA